MCLLGCSPHPSQGTRGQGQSRGARRQSWFFGFSPARLCFPRSGEPPRDLSPDGTAGSLHGSGASGEYPGPTRGTLRGEKTPGQGRFGKERGWAGMCGTDRSSLRAQRGERWGGRARRSKLSFYKKKKIETSFKTVNSQEKKIKTGGKKNPLTNLPPSTAAQTRLSPPSPTHQLVLSGPKAGVLQPGRSRAAPRQ